MRMISNFVSRQSISCGAPKAASALSIRGLRKSYNDKEVLKGVDLDIAAGSFIAIIGKSGCGKSTLVRILAGLEKADSGLLRFSDAPANESENKSHVRIMFQEPRLLPWRSVFENIRLGYQVGDNPNAAAAMTRKMLHALGLSEKADDWPSTLSGGQKQRVALGRALVSSPRILALDEPLGALDALTRLEMQRFIEEIWMKEKFTALLVTHDIQEALLLADRIIILDGGLVSFDQIIDLPRPRRRIDLASMEEVLLEKLGFFA